MIIDQKVTPPQSERNLARDWQPLRATYRGCLVYTFHGDFAWEDVGRLVALPEPVLRFLRVLTREGAAIEVSMLEEKGKE